MSEITYESNMPYALRFMIDSEIGGMTWIKIEKGKWQIRLITRRKLTAKLSSTF